MPGEDGDGRPVTSPESEPALQNPSQKRAKTLNQTRTVRVEADSAGGRDFVAGDVHGQFDTLRTVLAQVGMKSSPMPVRAAQAPGAGVVPEHQLDAALASAPLTLPVGGTGHRASTIRARECQPMTCSAITPRRTMSALVLTTTGTTGDADAASCRRDHAAHSRRRERGVRTRAPVVAAVRPVRRGADGPRAGDLVERGPHSSDALEWIERRFSAVTLGNHDDAALTWLEDKLDGSDEASYGWLRAIAPSAYARWRDAFASLPMAITVETSHGPVGIVHAESPHRSWTRATELLECDREVDVALLGLLVPAERLRRYRNKPVDGLRALVHGHEPVKEIERTANRWNIDTGAGIPRLNRLTLLEVNQAEIRSRTFDVDETGAGTRQSRTTIPDREWTAKPDPEPLW